MSAVGVYLPDNFEDDVVDKTKTELEMPAANDVPYSIEVDATVVCGTIYEEILKAIQVTGPDLVVMASHRPELKGLSARPQRCPRCPPRQLLSSRRPRLGQLYSDLWTTECVLHGRGDSFRILVEDIFS